jgi:hypothetical protein
MTPSTYEDLPIIWSLEKLEWKTLCWTSYAGRPQERGESYGNNTIQLPHIVRVKQGEIKEIFFPVSWIGDEEYPEWDRARKLLIRLGIEEVWSPVSIRVWSILLWSGEQTESIDPEDGTIYRHEWIDDACWWSNPENWLGNIKVQRFIEKIPNSGEKT